MSKPGSAGVASSDNANIDRRERLRKLALETIDLAKDPYFMKNHLGSYECKLCLTLHTNEGSYLSHTQGKKHQANLGRRAAKEAREPGGTLTPEQQALVTAMATKVPVRRGGIKIGRPGYTVTKIRCPSTQKHGLLFQIQYPNIKLGQKPRYRFMSSFEQRLEPPNKDFQYVLFSADPYETCAFKISSGEIDAEGILVHWNPDTHEYYFQFLFEGL